MFVLIAVTGLALPTNAQRGRAPNRASNFTIIEEVPGSQAPLHLAFVPTRDFIHTPIAMRKPQGDGPFPAVLFLTGNGGGGMARARWLWRRLTRLGSAPSRTSSDSITFTRTAWAWSASATAAS